jgi:hypothetical protein
MPDMTHLYLQVLIEMYDELELLDGSLSAGDVDACRERIRGLRGKLEALTGAKKVLFARGAKVSSGNE